MNYLRFWFCIQGKFNDQQCQLIWKIDSDESLEFKLSLKNENVEIFEKIFHTFLQNDKTGELLVEEYVGMIQDGQYRVSLQAICQYGISKWSEPVTIEKSHAVRYLMIFVTFSLICQKSFIVNQY